jgi:DNA repair exonuclease SbcCD ATPase subunit
MNEEKISRIAARVAAYSPLTTEDVDEIVTDGLKAVAGNLRDSLKGFTVMGGVKPVERAEKQVDELIASQKNWPKNFSPRPSSKYDTNMFEAKKQLSALAGYIEDLYEKSNRLGRDLSFLGLRKIIERDGSVWSEEDGDLFYLLDTEVAKLARNLHRAVKTVRPKQAFAIRKDIIKLYKQAKKSNSENPELQKALRLLTVEIRQVNGVVTDLNFTASKLNGVYLTLDGKRV